MLAKLPRTFILTSFTALLLTACSGSHDDGHRTESEASDVTASVAAAGPTPFISFIPLAGKDLSKVASYRFTIAAKTDAVSQPVDVTYTAAALVRGGHYAAGQAQAKVPVFGLYAGYQNRVSLELKYGDGSRQNLALDISTAPYVDPNGIFDRPTILKKRVAGSWRDLNYFYLKSAVGGPIVIDSDGQIRWTAPAKKNAYSSLLENDHFVVGEASSGAITRFYLDGSIGNDTLALPTVSKFHHSLTKGKTDIFGELDTLVGGVANIESVLVEFASSGTVGKQWDFEEIVNRYMRSQGDDPTGFVRPGIDWFHMNSAIYDPRDDSIIASSRENFVIKVDYSTGNVKWILGDPTKYWYTFPSLRAKALTLASGGLYPIGQHGLSINAAGDLMLFNNGAPSFNLPAGTAIGEARPYSAVSSYNIDMAQMTARETWRFDYDKSILSDVCSNVLETKGGSLLVNYATASSRTKARLVGLDPSRNVMFDFEYASKICDTSWAAEPIDFEHMNIL